MGSGQTIDFDQYFVLVCWRLTLSVIPVDAINELIQYLWSEEKRHFDAELSNYNDKQVADDFPDKHIFLSVKKVADWLNGLTLGEYEARATVRHFPMLEMRADFCD